MNPKGLENAAVIIRAVANGLAQQAIESMPRLREGETIVREWYKNGAYYRETEYNGKSSTRLYDFKLRECRLAKGVKSA
jgi:anti-sigma regulatory factor (Ser/Thr protein kinase)